MLKKLVIALVSLFAILVVGTGIYLLPAHLQIRTVGSPLPDAQALRALTQSPDKPVRVSAILTSSQRSTGRSLGHHAVVIEWADGRMFMIDAGMDEATSIEFGRLMEMLWSADPAKFHTTPFDALGDRSEQLVAVGFTHLHIDHVQGIQAACAGSPSFELVQSSQQHTLHNIHTEEGAQILEPCPTMEPIDAEALTEVPGFPGLAMYSLGGHTPGSTLFVVAIEDQVLLFSGDITNTKSDLIQDEGKGFLYSNLLVPEDTARTRQLRGWLLDMHGEADMQVYVSHDVADMRELNQRYSSGGI